MTTDTDHVNDLPPEISARIRQQVAKDLKPARGLGTLARLAIGAVAAALAIGVGAMMSEDIRRAPAGALVVVLGSVTAIALATGLSMARATAAPVRRRIVMSLLPPVAFYAVVLAAHAFEVHPADGVGGHALACLMRGGMLAALPLGVLVVLWRRADPFTPRLSGAILGGWAGLAGAVGLTLACPSGDFWHVALGHGGAVLGGAIVGAVLARRWLEP